MSSLTIKEIPSGGFCLSSFLVIRQSGSPEKILMGRINSEVPWDHIGALDENRARIHSKRWMLPSCHLIYGESPADAAKRISREQIGMEVKVGTPSVLSDYYFPKAAGEALHWDVCFVFESELSKEKLGNGHLDCWKELEFVETKSLKNDEIARSHGDILRFVGL